MYLKFKCAYVTLISITYLLTIAVQSINVNVYQFGTVSSACCAGVELCEAFSLFDKDGDGQITVDEVTQTMMSLGIDVRLTDVQSMVDQVDTDGQNVARQLALLILFLTGCLLIVILLTF